MKHPKNCNELAKLICESEGGKVNLSIAQVKEVLRILGDRHLDQFLEFKKSRAKGMTRRKLSNLILKELTNENDPRVMLIAAARRYLRNSRKGKK